MTNDLLEREEGAQAPVPEETGVPPESTDLPEAGNAPAAPETGTAGETAPEAAARPQEPQEEEKTVFAPSAWERRTARKAETQARQEDAQARRARQEAERQDKAAEREAKKLELKLAQEQRKAQEEQWRQERKRQDEERRQEQKRRDEEERLLRREEKAKQKTVRRVGTMTLGVSLILIGVGILLYMVNPSFDIRVISYLAPFILISLGVEVLIRYFFSKDRTYKYDFASGLICIFLVAGSFCVALVPYAMYYISPERFTSEEQLLQAEREKLYSAFQGDQRVEVFYVNGGMDYSPSSFRKDPDGRYVYELDYLRTRVHLLDGCASPEEFAQVCRDLLDKMVAQGIYTEDFGITFESKQNAEKVYYTLDIDNRLKLEMNTQNLVKLVNPVYTEPTLENGWFPGGYGEIADSYGRVYADHFADLAENYSEESLNIYYDLLMNSGRPDLAESYYEGLAGGEEGPVVPPEDQIEGEETPPEVPEQTPDQEGGEAPPEPEGQSETVGE